MPLFYFDIHDGMSGLDRVGKICSDREAARQEARRQAELLLASEGDWFRTGQEWQIGVTDSGGSALFNLGFGSSTDDAKAIQAASRRAAPFRGAKRRSVLSAASAGMQAN